MGLRSIFISVLAAVGTLTAVCSAEKATQRASHPLAVYSGMCDASGGVALSGSVFIVADNEMNVLSVYARDRAGLPLRSFAWDIHLGIDPYLDKHPQADIEGATLLGGHIYWITSHGRNKDGKWHLNRHRLFATTVKMGADGAVAVEPFGKPYQNLMIDMVHDQAAQGLGLVEALGQGIAAAERLAPKEEGLNIEGLAAAADGKSLLIGFRNPLADGKAILVPLVNPEDVLTAGARPRFGKPSLLRLEGERKGKRVALGIRSIEYSMRHGAYLIAAGPPNKEKVSALYRWSGATDEPPRLLPKATAILADLKDFTPEALIIYPDKDQVQILSDDGTLKVKVGSAAECKKGEFKNGQCGAKWLLDDRRKTFRGVWVEVE